MRDSPLPSRRRSVASSIVAAWAAIEVANATTSSSSSSSSSSSTSRRQLPTPHDLRVRDLDKVVAAYSKFPGRMYAGSLPMDHRSTTAMGANPDGYRTGNLQFWLFVPDVIEAENTMAAWFNGGPGCSSFSAGILFENSPVTVPLNPAGWCCEMEDEPLAYNEYGWTVATVMLYVEQPIGVGFSEATRGTPPPSHEDDVAADFDAFLQNFYAIFRGRETPDSEYDPRLDMSAHGLVLVGESYAGTYIPSVARGIYLNNVANARNVDGSERLRVPLAGIAIGNGKIDAVTQSRAVPDWAYWHGLIDAGTRDYYKAELDGCIRNMMSGIYGPGVEPSPFHSFTLRSDCGIFDSMLEAAGGGALDRPLDGGPNIYEYSTWDAYEAADGDNGTVSRFYNNRAVQEALNVPPHRRGDAGHRWEGCIPEVDADWVGSDPNDATDSPNFMDNDKPWDVTPYIAELLDDAMIDVLIYSGDRDMICNTQGSEAALSKMEWSGTRDPAPSDGIATKSRNAWTEAKRGLWLYDGYPAGYTKSYKNLNLLTVYNAGHMVPYNQPGPALDMMIRFLKAESFHDRPLVSYSSWRLPEDPTSKPPPAIGSAKESMVDEPLSDGSSGMAPPGTMMSAGCIVTAIALLVVTAFVAGMWVGRKTAEQGGVTSRTEMQPLKEDDNYGSI